MSIKESGLDLRSFRFMRRLRLTAALPFFAWLLASPIQAAPEPDLWEKWKAHNPESTRHLDHRSWDAFLKKYVVSDHPSGVNQIPYGEVAIDDKTLLEGYLKEMQSIPVTDLTRAEQKAYWINLYNALTVKVVLDHYPVESIRDIDISGFFSDGPWGAELLQIEGEDVTLDDIEHRILRPIWKDNRVHYGVNCASIGCPNLQPEAFTSDNTNDLLEKGAHEYVNHPRGARISDDTLILSSIYKWFQVDFGGSIEGVLDRLFLKYADKGLAESLRNFDGDVDYEYDWGLNDLKPGEEAN